MQLLIGAKLLVLVPRDGIGPPTHASSEAVGLYHSPLLNGDWALMWDYCWGSPTSLYTFLATECPTRLGSGLSNVLYMFGFPRIHPIFQSQFPRKAPKIPGHRSTTELPRQDKFSKSIYILINQRCIYAEIPVLRSLIKRRRKLPRQYSFTSK